MLELDHFKEINDTYGHLFGDDVLRYVGNALRDIEGAESYRYGGDEVCIVFTEKQIEKVLQQIQNAQDYLHDNIEIPDTKANVDASVGIACYTKGTTISDLLYQADNVMHLAKKSPHNGIVLYGKEL